MTDFNENMSNTLLDNPETKAEAKLPQRCCLVAVNAAVPGFFTYSIPEGMEVSVGNMVMVQFGYREMVGYVMQLGPPKQAITYELKPIMEVLRPEPLFDEAFTELVNFVSKYYIYPEGLSVKEILPGGIAPKLEKRLSLTELGMDLKPESFGEAAMMVGLLKDSYPNGLSVKGFREKHEIKLMAELVRKKQAVFRWEISSKGVGFSFEWIISKTENDIEGMRLGKNEKDMLDKLKDAPPTPLSHFRIFYKDALRIAKSLANKGLVEMVRNELSRDDPTRAIALPHREVIELTADQSYAVSEIAAALETSEERGFLLFGVTGSGKTEVYLRTADMALREGKGVLWLAPEIALTMGLEARVKKSLPSTKFSVLHSALSAGERHDHWLNLTRGISRLALGARSAVFAPIKNLGLIIVDEEHDWAYKQEDGLRYNGRDLALWRAKQSGAVIILGSATPSLESYYGTTTGRLKLLTMTSRPEGALLPEVRIIDRKNSPRGSKIIGPSLKEDLSSAFQKGEQALLFINRRGHSSVPVCLSCGESLTCPYCSLTLTLHGPKKQLPHSDYGEIGGIEPGSVLICHGCGYRSEPKLNCPSCGAAMVRYMGIGTEKLQEIVEKEFAVKGLRLDADSTRLKGGSKEILEAFGRKDADFMVGTQMAAKGHDFANLTVVGVVDADIGLHLPDFRAGERTFQLISQVAGRAGRAEKPGKVIIQTFNPDHYAITAASTHDYNKFFDSELKIRERLSLPPLGRLALIRFTGLDEGEIVDLSNKARTELLELMKGIEDGHCEILGPAPSPISKLKERYRYQIMLRSKTVKARHQVLLGFIGPFRKLIAKKDISMTVDVDPYHLL